MVFDGLPEGIELVLNVVVDLMAELGNGTETVRVAHYHFEYMQAPSAMEWNDLYVVLFPQSHRVAVFHKTFWEI